MFRLRTKIRSRSHLLCGAVACVAMSWASASAETAPEAPASVACIAGAPLSIPHACPPAPLRATDFPILFDLPMILDSRQFAAETAPVWVSSVQLRRANEPFSGAASYQLTMSQAVPRTPLSVSITTTMTGQAAPPGAEFVRPTLQPVQPATSITMRVGSSTESTPGWYLFAASNRDSVRWSFANPIDGSNRMGYQGGRVDMGRQVGFGLDLDGALQGMQLGLVYSQHEINTRRGGTDEDMVGMTLSRRR